MAIKMFSYQNEIILGHHFVDGINIQMENNIAKIDIEKNNSIPTQKQKQIRHPTPIKHRPSLQKELEEMDLEEKPNNLMNN